MPTRRQQKVARVVREAVSEAISNHLSDPRITGFVSVTRVDVSADLHNAQVYLSIFGGDEKSQDKTFAAISNARSRIQSFLAAEMKSKFCPVIKLCRDEQFKKTLETLKLIDGLCPADETTGPLSEPENGGNEII
jgi:ribosome-binding factor A